MSPGGRHRRSGGGRACTCGRRRWSNAGRLGASRPAPAGGDASRPGNPRIGYSPELHHGGPTSPDRVGSGVRERRQAAHDGTEGRAARKVLAALEAGRTVRRGRDYPTRESWCRDLTHLLPVARSPDRRCCVHLVGGTEASSNSGYITQGRGTGIFRRFFLRVSARARVTNEITERAVRRPCR